MNQNYISDQYQLLSSLIAVFLSFFSQSFPLSRARDFIYQFISQFAEQLKLFYLFKYSFYCQIIQCQLLFLNKFQLISPLRVFPSLIIFVKGCCSYFLQNVNIQSQNQNYIKLNILIVNFLSIIQEIQQIQANFILSFIKKEQLCAIQQNNQQKIYHLDQKMDIKSPMIQSTKQIIGNYAISVSLTKQMQIEVYRSLNQLDMLALIYVAENQQVKKFIDTQMLAMQKKVMQSTKASSGLFSRFIGGRSSKSAVSINDVWIKLSQNNAVKNYTNLVTQMGALKAKQQAK